MLIEKIVTQDCDNKVHVWLYQSNGDYLVSIGANLNYVHSSEQKGIFHLALW